MNHADENLAIQMCNAVKARAAILLPTKRAVTHVSTKGRTLVANDRGYIACATSWRRDRAPRIILVGMKGAAR